MDGRRGAGDGRTRRMLPLSALAPPVRGPARLQRAVRVTRVREALGRELGRRLALLHETERVVTLLFEDESWARASRRNAAAIAEALGPLLAGRGLVIGSVDGAGGRDAGRDARGPGGGGAETDG